MSNFEIAQRLQSENAKLVTDVARERRQTDLALSENAKLNGANAHLKAELADMTHDRDGWQDRFKMIKIKLQLLVGSI